MGKRRPKVFYLEPSTLELCTKYGLKHEPAKGRRKRPRCEEWLFALMIFVQGGLDRRWWRMEVEVGTVLRSAAENQAAASAAFRLGGRNAMLQIVCPQFAPMKNHAGGKVEVTIT